jgi:hypothetical protein
MGMMMDSGGLRLVLVVVARRRDARAREAGGEDARARAATRAREHRAVVRAEARQDLGEEHVGEAARERAEERARLERRGRGGGRRRVVRLDPTRARRELARAAPADVGGERRAERGVGDAQHRHRRTNRQVRLHPRAGGMLLRWRPRSFSRDDRAGFRRGPFVIIFMQICLFSWMSGGVILAVEWWGRVHDKIRRVMKQVKLDDD